MGGFALRYKVLGPKEMGHVFTGGWIKSTHTTCDFPSNYMDIHTHMYPYKTLFFLKAGAVLLLCLGVSSIYIYIT